MTFDLGIILELGTNLLGLSEISYTICTFFAAGTLLCVCIVLCNLAVIRVLCHLGCKGTRRKVLGRRIRRNSSRTRSVSSGNSTTGVLANGGDITYYNVSTPEELSFARLMAVLCVAFVVCWMPQMVIQVIPCAHG